MSKKIKLLTATDVAHMLEISPQAVRKLASRKSLPATKVGRAWLFDKDLVEMFARSRSSRRKSSS